MVQEDLQQATTTTDADYAYESLMLAMKDES
jgi:hypothetical protein